MASLEGAVAVVAVLSDSEASVAAKAAEPMERVRISAAAGTSHLPFSFFTGVLLYLTMVASVTR